jgi:hypothetical protein
MNEANNQLVENDSVQLNDNMVNDADRPPIIFTIEDSPPKTEVLQAENFFQIDGNIRVINQMYEQNLRVDKFGFFTGKKIRAERLNCDS